MIESKIHFHKSTVKPSADTQRLEPSTCVEAETFVLRVLDDSMEPEFRQGCIIVIDPTGHAKEGSYVLANRAGSKHEGLTSVENADEALAPVVFRQLHRSADNTWQLCALNERYNERYSCETNATELSDIIGVIVQRAGTRRRYHKHYQ